MTTEEWMAALFPGQTPIYRLSADQLSNVEKSFSAAL